VVTVLEYLVIAAAIGLVVFVLAVFVFGRGEQMSALSPRISPAELPDGAIAGEDVRRIRFGLALRGYRMSDVDWTLDRLADELDRLHRRVRELGGEPLPPGVDPTPDPELFPPDGTEPEPVLATVGARPAQSVEGAAHEAGPVVIADPPAGGDVANDPARGSGPEAEKSAADDGAAPSA
jgi:DivIVA domain-containing protein